MSFVQLKYVDGNDFITISSSHESRKCGTVEKNHLGRVEFELYGKSCPLCVENFARLCAGDMTLPPVGATEGIDETTFKDQFLPQLHYRGSLLHRVVPNYIVQGGDISSSILDVVHQSSGQQHRTQHAFLQHYMGVSRHNSRSSTSTFSYNKAVDKSLFVEPGTGAPISVFGEAFEASDEINAFPFDSEGLLGTAVSFPNANHSQWFVTLSNNANGELDPLNGTAVCFGRVVSGLDIFKQWFQSTKTPQGTSTGAARGQDHRIVKYNGMPFWPVVVDDCGLV